jgi:hypothetical protein
MSRSFVIDFVLYTVARVRFLINYIANLFISRLLLASYNLMNHTVCFSRGLVAIGCVH